VLVAHGRGAGKRDADRSTTRIPRFRRASAPFTYAFAERRGQRSPVVRRRMRSVVPVASRKSSPLSAFSAPDDAGSSNPGYRYCFKTVPEVLTFGIGDALAQLPNLPPEKPHLSANPTVFPLLSVTYIEHKRTTCTTRGSASPVKPHLNAKLPLSRTLGAAQDAPENAHRSDPTRSGLMKIKPRPQDICGP